MAIFQNYSGSVLPERVVLVTMAFFANAIAMSLRVSLSVAITEMVIPLNQTTIRNDSILCPVESLPLMVGDHLQIVSKYMSKNEENDQLC